MMLEVRHLIRTYKVKNSDPVYALNDVSLKFPETGLVFILGKSGSGKSTLLNVMGGLDKADDGEIIINGKSSKEFSGNEMDSYRNTYLGFIFQEYNILSDYTVKENIALALQLQHKKATDEAIDNILEEVDLKGYGKRKPNELSGGQKQRVAIARALVKEPKIIFGDEPTGALDSNTGKQVFETLKKLSKNKLVVIVSHDRDFAEHFGDRVIELKDGKVISDITKKNVESKSESSGLSLIGDNVVRIDKNRQLTAADLPLINKAIANAEGDVFITADSHANEAFCEAARIDKNGNRQEFFTTNPDDIKVGNDSFNLVKSKFSLGHAFKMGSKSMRVKPFRLVMTILLSTISFSLFGSAATLAMFSEKGAVKSAIQSNDISVLSLSYNEKNDQTEGLTADKIAEIKEGTGLNFYTFNQDKKIEVNFKSSTYNNDIFHMTSFNRGLEISEEMMNDFGFKLDYGRLPTNKNEICISLYSFYSFQDLGINSSDFHPEFKAGTATKDDVIGLTLLSYGFSGQEIYTITGIIDTNLPERLLNYRNNSYELTYGNPDYQSVSNLSWNSIHSSFFYGKDTNASTEEDVEIKDLSLGFNDGYYDFNGFGYYPSHENKYFFDKNKTSISSSEALVSQEILLSMLREEMNSQESISYVFEGAYTNYSKDEVFTACCQTSDLDWNLSLAAKYKTAIDKYEDFYTNDFEIAKAVNEGTYLNDGNAFNVICGWDEYGNITYTDEAYKNATDEQKYWLFKNYCDTYLESHDTSSKYYEYYLNAYESYLNDISNSYPSLKKAMTVSALEQSFGNAEMETINEYINEHYKEMYQKYKDTYAFAQILKDFTSDKTAGPTEEEIKSACTEFIYKHEGIPEYKAYKEIVKAKKKEVLASTDLSWFEKTLTANSNNAIALPNFKVVGVDFDLENYCLSISKEDVEEINEKLKEIGKYNNGNYVSQGYVGIVGKDLDKFLDFYYAKKATLSDWNKAENGAWRLTINNSEVATAENYGSIIAVMTQVFLYVGIALAVFSMLLFYNFISVSINNKKREIGILRAVGAKRSDVFKIFYSEAFIIAAFNFVLSSVATFVISIVMNNSFQSSTNLGFTIMNPNALIVLLLLGVSLLTSLISSALPVTRIANKKPIDAIQNR